MCHASKPNDYFYDLVKRDALDVISRNQKAGLTLTLQDVLPALNRLEIVGNRPPYLFFTLEGSNVELAEPGDQRIASFSHMISKEKKSILRELIAKIKDYESSSKSSSAKRGSAKPSSAAANIPTTKPTPPRPPSSYKRLPKASSARPGSAQPSSATAGSGTANSVKPSGSRASSAQPGSAKTNNGIARSVKPGSAQPSSTTVKK